MGMSTHISAFRPPDATWLQMKAVYDACVAANLPIPDAVDKFFGGNEPDPSGVEIPESELVKYEAVITYTADMRDGYEVVIANLPVGVKTIRVWNSY